MSDASGDEIHLHNVEELVDEVGAECVATITKIITGFHTHALEFGPLDEEPEVASIESRWWARCRIDGRAFIVEDHCGPASACGALLEVLRQRVTPSPT